MLLESVRELPNTMWRVPVARQGPSRLSALDVYGSVLNKGDAIHSAPDRLDVAHIIFDTILHGRRDVYGL
jgi:hypothetical protein